MIKLPCLKNERVALLTIGNIMRADDGFGPLLYEELKPYARQNFLPLNGAELPESQTSTIKKFKPAVLILADAALMPGRPAGALQLAQTEDILNPALSTHTLPLNVMLKFLKDDLPGLKVFFIAANAANTDFDGHTSPAIYQAVKTAARAIIKALNG